MPTRKKVIIRQHPLLKDWEVSYRTYGDYWAVRYFKTKRQAENFARTKVRRTKTDIELARLRTETRILEAMNVFAGGKYG
jgi:hypothetical protein